MLVILILNIWIHNLIHFVERSASNLQHSLLQTTCRNHRKNPTPLLSLNIYANDVFATLPFFEDRPPFCFADKSYATALEMSNFLPFVCVVSASSSVSFYDLAFLYIIYHIIYSTSTWVNICLRQQGSINPKSSNTSPSAVFFVFSLVK